MPVLLIELCSRSFRYVCKLQMLLGYITLPARAQGEAHAICCQLTSDINNNARLGPTNDALTQCVLHAVYAKVRVLGCLWGSALTMCILSQKYPSKYSLQLCNHQTLLLTP